MQEAGWSEGGLDSIIKNGKVPIDDLKANPSLFSGKSVDEIAQALTDAGYDVTVKASTRSRSGAQIIKINNIGGEKIFLKFKFCQMVEDMEVVRM